jgi:energy-coupling factor transport system ATP-binding protein
MVVPQDIITFKNVNFSYSEFSCQNKTALKNINLSIAQGEFLAVMGENGAGKTTFCRLINGIVPHSSGGRLTGIVTVDGERTDESSVPRLAVKVGMVLDDPDTQLFTSSVRHEAAFGPENILLPPEEIEERIAFALKASGLAGFEERQPATLSGGEKQRLAIAAALAMKGKILVLDEPLARLDPQGAAEVMTILREFREKFQITIIMADGGSNMAADFADRVCILKNGQIAACDTAKKIFADNKLLEENGIQPLDGKFAVCQARFSSSILYKRQVSASLEVVNKDTITNKPEKNAIEIVEFCYSYGQDVRIENINLSIKDNDFAAITGRNGCGKTTLLKNITGLLHPSSGDIYIHGRNTKKLSVSDISKDIGFVMQNPGNQLFTDTVYNEAAFALKTAGLAKEEIQKRVQDALCTAGLKDPQAFPPALSVADRTKTVIACVLAMGCKIIIFDEVDVGQDYSGSIKIMDIARNLHSKGYTIIFVTHNLSLACKYARRMIMMDRKGIIYDERNNQ